MAVLMGGNVVGSSGRSFVGWSGGTLLGPEGAAREGGRFVRVQAWRYTVRFGGAGGGRGGLGFGGVFVNWIVDASI